MTDLGISGPVEIIDIQSHDEAVGRKFLGSPTIRINGVDIDPSARSENGYGLQCRVYRVDGVLSGAPSTSMVKAALEEAMR